MAQVAAVGEMGVGELLNQDLLGAQPRPGARGAVPVVDEVTLAVHPDLQDAVERRPAQHQVGESGTSNGGTKDVPVGEATKQQLKAARIRPASVRHPVPGGTRQRTSPVPPVTAAPECGTIVYMPMPEYASITALDALLAGLRVGQARRRQLGMVRGELYRALERGGLPVAARRSLRRLLEKETLTAYLRLAESGALRERQVNGGCPPTSQATNAARHRCLHLLRTAYGLPALRLGSGGRIPLRPTPDHATLAALRRRLDADLTTAMSPGHTRLTALLALVLDAAPRAGELTALRLSDLAPGHAAVFVRRRPQHGIDEADDAWFALSPLARAALERWLAVRAELVARAHGTSRLWVSLFVNHDGTRHQDGRAVLRPPGLPLEEKGLLLSYRTGRARYHLTTLLPPKLEQLRRAVLDHTPPQPLTGIPTTHTD
ncbi:hypothetical protein GCM10010129_07830 [Streptomyces fumigatiscleroticus]|nr:hypothetical protein GCM10010129_07830 [Streptomyces fumigatiscleroticus]